MLRPCRRQATRLLFATVLFFLAVTAQAGNARPRENGPAPRVLVAYYSLTGNTEKMATGVAEGFAGWRESEAAVKRVDEVSKQDLEAADGIVLGSPTYYANIPGKMKVVIDDWSWKMKVDFTDKVGGAFSTGGGQTGGKEHVVESLCFSCSPTA